MGRWNRAPCFLAAIPVATACAPSPHVESRPVAAPAAATRPPPLQPWRPAVDLPVSATAEPIPRSAFPVFISGRLASIGQPAKPVVTLAGDAAHPDWPGQPDGGGFVQQLAQAVQARPCGPGGFVEPIAAIHIDAKMPYRLLIDALYTLSEIGYAQLFVATRPSGPSLSRSSMGIRVSGRRNWQLVVAAKSDGFWLRAPGFKPGPRCPGQDTAPLDAPTLPATRTGLDFAALRRCVDAIAPAGSALYLSTGGDLPVQTAVTLADTLSPGRYVTLAFPTPRAMLARVGSQNAPPRGMVSNAAQVVGGLRSMFRACYNAELARNPQAGGTIRLTLRVGADGNVVLVIAAASGNLGGAVECVRSAAGTAHFAPPRGGSAVVNVPVTFVSRRTATAGGPACTRSR